MKSYRLSYTINLPDDTEITDTLTTSDFNQAIDMLMTDQPEWYSMVLVITEEPKR